MEPCYTISRFQDAHAITYQIQGRLERYSPRPVHPRAKACNREWGEVLRTGRSLRFSCQRPILLVRSKKEGVLAAAITIHHC